MKTQRSQTGRTMGCCAGVVLLCVVVLAGQSGCSSKPAAIDPSVVCLDPAARDQDDMCIWINPRNTADSTVVTADKKADAIFVYDLRGKTLHTQHAHKPGNIDVRYGCVLGGRTGDIIAWNERGSQKIVVCSVDPATRSLERIDDGTLHTFDAYGGALYQSLKTKDLYFFTTSKTGLVSQYLLHDNGSGRVCGSAVRTLHTRACEAAVADDRAGVLYVSVEKEGVWAFGAEPADNDTGRLITAVGRDTLRADVEGVAIYPAEQDDGFLIVSSQGNSRFNIYERRSTHRFVAAFQVRGVAATDGIDVAAVNFGGDFSGGLFACHNGASPERCPVVLVPWRSIAETLGLRQRADHRLPGT